jgi:hypothetical protein
MVVQPVAEVEHKQTNQEQQQQPRYKETMVVAQVLSLELVVVAVQGKLVVFLLVQILVVRVVTVYPAIFQVLSYTMPEVEGEVDMAALVGLVV